MELLPATAAPPRAVVQRAVPFSLVDGGMPPTGLPAAAAPSARPCRRRGVDVHEADIRHRRARRSPPGMKVTVLSRPPGGAG